MRHLKAHTDSLVIGIFFIGVSALVGWMMVIEPIREHYQLGKWARVPATITSVKLLKSQVPSDSVITYECQASYRYMIGEKAFEASDVSIYEGSDNLSNFHHRIFQELSNYEKSGKPFQAYVNPQNPEEAILYRNIRWGVTIGVLSITLLFTSAGVVLLVKTAKEIFPKRQSR